MSFPNNLDPYNFFRQLFGGSSSSGERKGREGRGDFFGGSGRWNFDDMFREFDEMRREMSRTFSEQFKNIENKVPKDLIKEYETPEGAKVREVGPIVYGYSMTIGPDGKTKDKRNLVTLNLFLGEDPLNNHRFQQRENL